MGPPSWFPPMKKNKNLNHLLSIESLAAEEIVHCFYEARATSWPGFETFRQTLLKRGKRGLYEKHYFQLVGSSESCESAMESIAPKHDKNGLTP